MSWRAPHLLWLLTLVPLLGAGLWWAVIQRRRALLRFAQARLLASLVPALSPGLDDRRQLWRAGLLLGAVSLLLLALAGPQWGLSWETLERRGGGHRHCARHLAQHAGPRYQAQPVGTRQAGD